MSSLLQPITIGGRHHLRNRIAMASMTRNRCLDDNHPGQAQVKHYTDRARDGPGLIITEGTFIDWTGCEWEHAPFMITHEHAAAWRKVTDAVHEVGGTIYMQAWHAGRIQHDEMPIMKAKNGRVLAPSAIPAAGGKYCDLPGSPGHTSNIEAIPDPREVVETYRRSAQLAKEAGFDGIELLAQGGYLVHQFLNTRSNTRTDLYGGSVENRCRFLLEVIDTMSEVFGGSDRLGVKICPADVFNDAATTFEELKATFTYLIEELVKRELGIICISRRGAEPATRKFRPDRFPIPKGYDPVLDFGALVKFPGSPSILMANEGYTLEEATQLMESGKADMVALGRAFIFNPDLVSRIEKGHPLEARGEDTLVKYGGPYQPVDQGYNDWPSLKVENGARTSIRNH